MIATSALSPGGQLDSCRLVCMKLPEGVCDLAGAGQVLVSETVRGQSGEVSKAQPWGPTV